MPIAWVILPIPTAMARKLGASSLAVLAFKDRHGSACTDVVWSTSQSLCSCPSYRPQAVEEITE